jgi:hypothetical protein
LFYRRAAGTNRFLCAAGIHDEWTLGWVNKMWIVPVSDVSEQKPSVHDAGLSFIASSIEIAVRKANGLKFLTHLDIFRNASREAREAQSPLSIPIPGLLHTLKSGKQVASEKHPPREYRVGAGLGQDMANARGL